MVEMWEGTHLEQSLSIKVNGNLGCSYRNVMLHGLCVFKANLSLFELFPKTSGIWEPCKIQQTSCRRARWNYDFMVLEMVLERHSDSQIPRNTKGGNQGNAVTTLFHRWYCQLCSVVTLLGEDLALLQACFPPPPPPPASQITSLDWIKKAAHSASKIPQECSKCTGQKGAFPN